MLNISKDKMLVALWNQVIIWKKIFLFIETFINTIEWIFSYSSKVHVQGKAFKGVICEKLAIV